MQATHDDRTTGLTIGAAMRRGSGRSINEDCYDFDPDGRWFVVADGVGGRPGGAVASQLICELLAPELNEFVESTQPPSAESLRQVVTSAHVEFLRQRKDRPGIDRMASTVTVAVVLGNTLFVAWLGDCRAYLVRNRRATAITRDHRLVSGMVELGLLSRRRATDHPWRNVLDRFVGADAPDGEPDVETVELQPGDRVVLTTDGLTDHVDARSIGRLVDATVNVHAAADSLLRAAVRAGTTDDATCLIAFVDDDRFAGKAVPFRATFLGPMFV